MPRMVQSSPVYAQLRDALVDRIVQGGWKAGDRLPAEDSLAREYGVSSGTVRKALDVMEAELLVTRRQGRGTFVNDPASGSNAARFIRVHRPDGSLVLGDVTTSDIVETDASEAERARLSLKGGSRVFRIQRLRLADEKPFIWEVSSVPAAMFPGLAAKPEVTGRIHSIAQEYGLLIGKAQERISVSAAAPDIAQRLGIDPGTPIAVLDRVARNTEGTTVEWRMAWCHMAQNYYEIDL